MLNTFCFILFSLCFATFNFRFASDFDCFNSMEASTTLHFFGGIIISNDVL